MKGIYKITNIINNKVYIGQAFNIKIRWQEEKKCHKVNQHLKRSFLKYGLENFTFEILEETDNLNEREKFWIKHYNSNNYEYGYNKTSGGDKEYIFSEDTIEKLRKASSGENNYMYGKHHTEETKEKIRKAKTGQKGWNKGVPMREESKKKLITSLSKIKHDKENSPRSKKVICLETSKTYINITEAAKETSTNRASISFCCKGKLLTAGGYHWRYYNNNNYDKKIKESKWYKKIMCIETGEIFETIMEASKTKEVPYDHIRDFLRGRRKKLAGGYHWQICGEMK